MFMDSQPQTYTPRCKLIGLQLLNALSHLVELFAITPESSHSHGGFPDFSGIAVTVNQGSDVMRHQKRSA